jgi:hypothetical protein
LKWKLRQSALLSYGGRHQIDPSAHIPDHRESPASTAFCDPPYDIFDIAITENILLIVCTLSQSHITSVHLSVDL